MEFTLRLAQRDDVADAADIMTNAFIEREPLTVAFGVRAEEFRDFATEIVGASIRQGLASIALTEQGECVGIRALTRWDYRPTIIPNSLRPIVRFLAGLYEDAAATSEHVRSRAAHVQMVGVTAAYEGRGIGRKLFEHSTARASDQGLLHCFGEVTCPRSTAIVMKYQPQVLARRRCLEARSAAGDLLPETTLYCLDLRRTRTTSNGRATRSIARDDGSRFVRFGD